MTSIVKLIKSEDNQVVFMLGFMNLMSWGTIYATKSVPRAFRVVFLLAVFVALASYVIKKHTEKEKKTAADWFFIVFPAVILALLTGFGFYLWFGLMAGIAQYYGVYQYIIGFIGLIFAIGILRYIWQAMISVLKG